MFSNDKCLIMDWDPLSVGLPLNLQQHIRNKIGSTAYNFITEQQNCTFYSTISTWIIEWPELWLCTREQISIPYAMLDVTLKKVWKITPFNDTKKQYDSPFTISKRRCFIRKTDACCNISMHEVALTCLKTTCKHSSNPTFLIKYREIYHF